MEVRDDRAGAAGNVRLVQLRRNVALLRQEVATQIRPELWPIFDALLDHGEAAIGDCERARARRQDRGDTMPGGPAPPA